MSVAHNSERVERTLELITNYPTDISNGVMVGTIDDTYRVEISLQDTDITTLSIYDLPDYANVGLIRSDGTVIIYVEKEE
jgi:hypothetical protein